MDFGFIVIGIYTTGFLISNKLTIFKTCVIINHSVIFKIGITGEFWVILGYPAVRVQTISREIDIRVLHSQFGDYRPRLPSTRAVSRNLYLLHTSINLLLHHLADNIGFVGLVP